jgi:AraC-like DNA-binding protein
MAKGEIPGILGLQDTEHLPFYDGVSCRVKAAIPGVIGGSTSTTQQSSDGSSFGNAYLFILADEVLPSGKLVRKVLTLPNHTAKEIFAANPEIYGLSPRNSSSTASIGDHALGNNNSRYISASTNKGGAPNFKGRSVYIDINKAKAAGVTIHTTEEIITDLDRISKNQPKLRHRIERLKSVIQSIEKEVLLEGHVPSSALKSQTSIQISEIAKKAGFSNASSFTRFYIRCNQLKPLEYRITHTPKPH